MEERGKFYKCPKSVNPRKENLKYKTPNAPKDDDFDRRRKSGYKNEDITHAWGSVRTKKHRWKWKPY